MKKQLAIFLLTLAMGMGVYAQKDPVLMKVGDKKVTQSEFLQIYLKNNPNPKFDKASLDEYMVLFKKFQMKVAEAEALGYDTIPSLKKELEGYQKQLSLPYLTDSSVNEYLVKEAYERTKNEIRASHILIRLEPNAKPADTLAASNRIMDLRKQIVNGRDFAEAAKDKRGSEDPSVEMNGGDLGYFTAFQMVYPFEDAAFNTKVGDVSMPVRTRFGYHIIKVTDKRPSRGTIQAAHIMIAARKDASDEEKASAEKKIQEIYDLLKAGGDFEELAKKYSEDPNTANRGGVLPVFGTGAQTRMVVNFEDAAFGLKKDGDISEPVQTDYGFHLIKRLSWTPVKSYDELKKELQMKVNRDDRAKKTQDSFVAKLKKEYKFKDKSKGKLVPFSQTIDSAQFYKGQWSPTLKKGTTLFKLNGENYSTVHFAEYLQKNYRNVKIDENAEMVKEEYPKFVKETVLNLEESKLASKYPAYKALLQEYHDGILLYEIMTDKVWSAAVKDTTGLKEFYEKNAGNYRWKERYNAVVYECQNARVAEQVYELIQRDTINSKHVLEVMNAESELNVKVRTNKFEWQDTDFLQKQKLQLGANAPYSFDGKYLVVKVDEILTPENKSFSECKGTVTADYQNELERRWLEELAQKHPVVVYDEVLYSLGK